MNKKKLGLDAGHAESTFDTTGSKGVWYIDENGQKQKFEEHWFNAAVVLYAKELAELNGFDVVLTQQPFGSVDTPLSKRVQIAKDEKVDLLFSFHADASSDTNARGHWCFFWQGHEPSGRLALAWDKNADILMNATLDRNYRESVKGTWTEFAMCRDPIKYGIPSILMEHAFFTNGEDRKLLMSEDFQRKCAKVAIKSACDFFGFPFIEKERINLSYDYNKIYKERIYATNGKLIRCDGNYKIPATDVRLIKFATGKTRYKFVYEKGAKVSELVKKHKADFGFNGPFFYNNLPLGNSEDNDKVISTAYGKMLKWHEFAVVNGKPIIGQQNKQDQQDLLVQGAPLLVENGALVYEKYRINDEVQDDIGKSRCQRTFIWIDTNGDLNVGIADGRTKDDQGLTLEEMALFAKEHGAVMALNFDGGGSTIIADKNGGINQKENIGVNERVVHHALLVFIDKDEDVNSVSDYQPVKIDLINSKLNKTETVDGIIKDGVSYVPLRIAGNFFEAKVGYDSTTKKPSLTK